MFAVDQLIADAMAAVGTAGQPALRSIVPAIEALVTRPDFLPQRFTSSPRPDKPHGVYLVFAAPDDSFTMLTGIWPPGASTDIHDHSGHWAVDAIIDGRLEITRYRRLDDAGVGERAAIEVVDVITQGPGEAIELVPGESDVHEVRNESGGTVVTFHVNAFDLVSEQRLRFDRDTGILSQRIHPASYDNVPATRPDDECRPTPVAGSV